MLKIKWNLHCPYRPQASGQVERSNRTIKTRLSKMHQEGVPWVEALPAVLCSMRVSRMYGGIQERGDVEVRSNTLFTNTEIAGDMNTRNDVNTGQRHWEH